MEFAKNHMEDAIRMMTPKVLESMDGICSCDRCASDRMAYALNLVPPKYVVTARGEVYTKVSLLENQSDASIIAAITQAALAIKASPRHD
ncbi:MAG: late competence development ComFB family protein [Defluviitaleaceae bacterium]|nr:late competence development ComFB family protein [Defluviitaleaceae bacterium]